MRREDLSIYQLMAAMDGEVELYPVNDEDNYDGELQEIYERLRVMNNEYKEKLESFYYLAELRR